MAVWLVRAGRRGENEADVLEHGIASIGWEWTGDLSSVTTREQLMARLKQTYPDAGEKRLMNHESQIWPFLREIQVGDIVALPLKTRPAVAFGRVTGDYRFRPEGPHDGKHVRPVEWFREIPRENIDQDLKYSLGAFMTVCRIKRNNAEQRILALLNGKAALPQPVSATALVNTAIEEEQAIPDLEALAKDQIREYILAKFKGHGLARLVSAVLAAQGYTVRESPEGADGGVDILAAKGPLGFDPPRLAVQVKSEQSPVDVKVFRELKGVMDDFGAQHGMVVAWGGFRGSVTSEAARAFFNIRLWSSNDLIEAIQANYDKLPEDLQAELPLKRIWLLVPEGGG